MLGLSLIWAPERARADDRWLFVPVLSAQPPRDIAIPQLTSAFEIELRASQQNVLSNGDAGVLFEARHSSEPVKLNTDEMSRLLRSVGPRLPEPRGGARP